MSHDFFMFLRRDDDYAERACIQPLLDLVESALAGIDVDIGCPWVNVVEHLRQPRRRTLVHYRARPPDQLMKIFRSSSIAITGEPSRTVGRADQCARPHNA